MKILIVRSVEETAPGFFTPEQVQEADAHAGDIASGTAWIPKRASYLASLLPEDLQRTVSITRVPPKRLLIIGVPVFLAGVFANFLGPAATFHVLYNPLTALVLWNLLIFVVFVVAGISSLPRAATVPGWKRRATDGNTPPTDKKVPPHHRRVMPFSHRVMASLWMRLNQISGRLHGGESNLPVSDVLKKFWEYYTGCCGALASSRLRLLFHVCALALIAGAIAGMYVRGVFLEYAVVWRSTFVLDPEVIRLLLNLCMGLPSQILTGSLIPEAQVRELMSASGSPAASWIHLLTVTTLLFAALPRAVLLCLEAVRLRAGALFVKADMAGPYYEEITRKAWEIKTDALRKQIDTILSRQTVSFSERVALFVREQLYDKSIVPLLTSFREEGGRIADLEKTIKTYCRDFEKPLEHYITALQDDMRSSLSSDIFSLIGSTTADPDLAIDHGSVYTSVEGASRSRGEELTDTFAGMVHMTITTVITGTIATVSGGLGKSIGVAIISVLLHTTGPVGLLIGAVIGLMVAGGVSWATKDMVSEAVKDYPLPSLMMRTLFSEDKLREKIEEGRAQIYLQVEEETRRQMGITSERLRESLLASLMSVMRTGRQS